MDWGVITHLICFFCLLSYVSANNGTRYLTVKRSLLSPFKTVCYGKLGCFYNGPPFYNPVLRPISLSPFPPELYLTTFSFYSRRNRQEPYIFTPFSLEAVLSSSFNVSSWTRIIIPGFLDGELATTFLQEIKDVYLASMDDNIITVNYAQYPSYSVAIANARGLGAQIALLIQFIQKTYGYPAEKFHLVGHSLGAQICAYAGERIHNLGRITGLDPGGPGYENRPDVVILDASDALFVDVIHTNPGRIIIDGLGTVEDVGHVNFWPAGGRPKGCPLTLLREFLTGSRNFIPDILTCQHRRSVEFMIFSFGQNGCFFVGVECLSYESFQKGQCNCGTNGERCRFMGQFSSPATNKSRYYLQVGIERPYYCLFQYQVIVFLKVVPEKVTHETTEAALNLIIEGDSKIQATKTFNINLMEQKKVLHLLITSKVPLGQPRNAVGTLHRAFNLQTIKQSPVADFKAVMEAIEINYLFPLPKKYTSTLLCKKDDLHQFEKNLTVFSTDACNYLYKNHWKNSTSTFAPEK
ncbi:pancreatic lipase-related protein 2-like [Stegodyphus dumicola]|uniref:pancreatic lipase-related protein 2-like n=1 Tax=Stegodyphus dumicola TaxID=202533 RepID=UPI0015AC9124|nr:pancreatic lipase-related protein 2-like [Stegodyphus dumicola]